MSETSVPPLSLIPTKSGRLVGLTRRDEERLADLLGAEPRDELVAILYHARVTSIRLDLRYDLEPIE